MFTQVELDPQPVDLVSDIESDVKRLIRDLTKGIAYTAKGFIAKRGRVSLPGETPSFQTGNLGVNITTEISDFDGAIKFNAPYSGFLEFGTDRMKPRPFIEKAIDTELAKSLPSL